MNCLIQTVDGIAAWWKITSGDNFWPALMILVPFLAAGAAVFCLWSEDR